MKLKSIALAALSSVLVFAAGCGQQDTASSNGSNNSNSSGEFKIVYAHSAAETSNTHKTGVKFKEELEKRSNGKIKVDVFSQYAGDREILESMQRGDIGMTVSSTAPLVLFNKTLAVFDLPFLFPSKETPEKSMEAVYQVLDSAESQSLLNSLDEVGLKGLGFMGLGFREVTSNKEVQKLEDLEGLKIRTMENKYHLATWEALGANPTPISFSELFTAIEQGTVDAQENPYEIINTSKFYEVQKYLIHTDHIFNTTALTISKKVYDSIPADQKADFEEAVKETVTYSRNLAMTDAKAHLENIEKNGTKVINLTNDEKQKMIDATQPVWEQIKQDVGEEVVNNMVKAVESVQ